MLGLVVFSVGVVINLTAPDSSIGQAELGLRMAGTGLRSRPQKLE